MCKYRNTSAASRRAPSITEKHFLSSRGWGNGWSMGTWGAREPHLRGGLDCSRGGKGRTDLVLPSLPPSTHPQDSRLCNGPCQSVQRVLPAGSSQSPPGPGSSLPERQFPGCPLTFRLDDSSQGPLRTSKECSKAGGANLSAFGVQPRVLSLSFFPQPGPPPTGVSLVQGVTLGGRGRGVIPLPPGDNYGCHIGGAPDMELVEARDAAQHPTVPRTAPPQGMTGPKCPQCPGGETLAWI